MKTQATLLILAVSLFTSISFARAGSVMAAPSTAQKNTLGITIGGLAAVDISAHLKKNKIPMERDLISGALVQRGKGIRCISQHGANPLYCYVQVVGDEVK